jgi:xanthine dehydrogenase accessory factor
MNQLRTWKLVEDSLLRNIPVMLLYVLESSGSSPGRQGFFMAVNANGDMEGSIGGGIMEHKFVEMAREKMRTGIPGSGLRKQIHNKEAATNQSGMICSGEQTIFLYPFKSADKKIITALLLSLEQDRNGTLLLTPGGIQFDASIPALDHEYRFQSETDWSYKEKTGYKNKLFIIGGGHCALAFSRLMRQMDFYITLFEERPGLNTLEKNVFAHEVIIVDDYRALSNLIPAGPQQYVVIMTMGYRTDDVALRALLDKPFTYIGVLGSKKKIAKLFDDYRKEGIAEQALQRIHSPVGLAIRSQTPEEIAISIAAGIIRVKNQPPR